MNPSIICNPLLEECSHLREGTAVVLGLTSSELIQEQIQLREEQKVRMREGTAKLDDQIADIEAHKRLLNIARGYLTTDTKKIESYFWSVLRDEKEATRDTRPSQ